MAESDYRILYPLVLKLGNSIKNHIGLYACGALALGLAVALAWEPAWLMMLIPVALLLMLYPMMLDVGVGDLGKQLRNPMLLVMALMINFALSPLLIFGLSWICVPLSLPAVMTGLILFGTVPCGGMVPAFTSMLGGNVSLAVTVTALSLSLSVLAVPLWADILMDRFIPVPPLLIAKHLAVIIAVPLLLAELTRRVVTRKRGHRYFQRLRGEVQMFSGAGLLLFLFSVFGSSGRMVVREPALIPSIMLPAACFVIASLALSTLLARLAGADRKDAVALTMSTAIKNNAIAIALAASAFGPEVALVNATTGPLVQLPIMLSYLWLNTRAVDGIA